MEAKTEETKPAAPVSDCPPVDAMLYVRNLPFEITEKAILDTFSPFGTVHTIKITPKRESHGKAQAYIAFTDIESAEKAYQSLDQSTINGFKIRVMYSQKNFITGEKRPVFKDDPHDLKYHKWYPPSDPSKRASLEEKRKELERMIVEEINDRYRIRDELQRPPPPPPPMRDPYPDQRARYEDPRYYRTPPPPIRRGYEYY